MRPAGSGRFAVRRILASRSASYHWLSAPQAPAPSAMHRIAVKPSTAGGIAGAVSRPQRPVKTTRYMTRGFVSARMSRQSAGSAAGFVSSMAGIARAYKGLAERGKDRVATFIRTLLSGADEDSIPRRGHAGLRFRPRPRANHACAGPGPRPRRARDERRA